MKLPIIAFAHVIERRANAALRGNSVRARWENLGNTGRLQSGSGHAKRGAQTCAASANNNNVILMVSDFIRTHNLHPFLCDGFANLSDAEHFTAPYINPAIIPTETRLAIAAMANTPRAVVTSAKRPLASGI